VEVWVEARKPDPALRPGMTVQVSMTAKTVTDAIVVPTAAVFRNEEAGDYVLVAGSDSKAHLKKVQVGIRNKDSAQIVSGINAGDAVITTGGYGLPDGTLVKIEASEKDESAGADGEKDKKDTADPKGATAAKSGKGKE
jgi:HlyD family secretion protein